MGKKVLAFLLALAMVLSVLPVGMLAAQEVSAVVEDAPKVTLRVAPVVHETNEENVENQTLSAMLYLSTDKAFTLGSLEFTAAPKAGTTLSFNTSGAQIPVKMTAQMAGENPTGKLLFTWLFDKAVTDAEGNVLTPSTQIALKGFANYCLGMITLSSAEPISLADANLQGVLAGLFDSAETNGVTYDVQVVYDETYTKGGHGDASVTWTALDAAGAAKLTKDNIVNNAHYYLTEDAIIKITAEDFIDKTFTICLNGHNLKGNGNARLFRLESGVDMTICDCQKKGTISNPKADGTGYNSAQGNLIGMVNGDCKLTLQDVWLDGLGMSAGTSRGGAIWAGYASTLIMENCVSVDFAAPHGGVLDVTNTATVDLDGCRFINNSATDGCGGAVYIGTTGATFTADNCVFDNNETLVYAQNAKGLGSAVYGRSKMTFTGCKITNNRAKGHGAIYLNGTKGPLTLNNCVMTGNTAEVVGGSAIYNETGSLVHLNSCTITDNRGASGAIYPSGTSAIVVSGSTVVRDNFSNSATERNIYIVAASSTNTLAETGYLNINGLTDGADIGISTPTIKTDANKLLREYVDGVQKTWEDDWLSYDNNDCYIHYENKVASFLNTRTHTPHDSDTWTAISSATDTTKMHAGGKFYLANNVDLSAAINLGETYAQNKNVTLCLNGFCLGSAKTSRIFRLSNGCSVTICDCTASGDVADGTYVAGKLIPGTVEGGAVGMYYMKDGVNKTAFTLEDGIIDGKGITNANRAPAIMASGYSGATITINGGEIRNCSSTYVSTDTKSGGGAIHTLYGAKLYINGGKFSNNTTVDNGGVICAEQGSDVKITAGLFCNNKAKQGGAIYASCGPKLSDGITTRYSKLNITGGEFCNNTATAQGGALYINNGTTDGKVEISNAAFSGNTASCGDVASSSKYGGGGAIRLTDGNLSITDCRFDGNTSKKCGAAIYTTSKDGLELTNCQVTNNNNGNDGSVYVVANSVNTFKNCVFTGNLARTVGGSAINNETSSTLTLDGCTVTNNKASTIGEAGGVYTSGSSALVLKGATVIRDNVMSNGLERNIVIKAASASSTVAGKGMLNVNGLTSGANVSVFTSTTDVRETADKLVQVYPTNGVQSATWDDSWIQYENSNKVVDYENGVFVFKTLIAQVENACYTDLSEALVDAADSGKVATLYANITGTAQLPAGTLKLDLNGKNINNLTGTGTVILTDSKTDDYDVEDGKYGKITNVADTVELVSYQRVDGKRYIVLTDENGTHAHRIYAAVSAKALRAADEGIGCTAKFGADKVLCKAITGYGMDLSANGGEAKCVDVKTLRTGKFALGKDLVFVVSDFFKDGEDNNARAGYEIAGTPFVTVGQQKYTDAADTQKVTFKQMFNYADEKFDTIGAAAQAAIYKLYADNTAVITAANGWSVTNVSQYAAQ